MNITLESWPTISFPLDERTTGEGAQLHGREPGEHCEPEHRLADRLVHLLELRHDGTFDVAIDVRGTTERSQIRAVELNLLLDMNPGKSPVYTHLRSTAQLRNTR